MLARLIKPPKSHSFFIFGARGTGKTTYLKTQILSENSVYLNLLLDRDHQELAINPDSLGERIVKGITKIVVIDEVQKLPKLLDIVHDLSETNKDIQFILTGSSARKLKRGGANLLAGRAFVLNLYPFTTIELGDQFDLFKALRWGTLPKIFELNESEDKENYLRTYVFTYLKEEILQEQIIRNLDPFQRFLPVSSQVSGQVVNYSKISKEVGAAPQTIQSYFEILQDTLIGFYLPAYHSSVRKQEKSGKKFYLFDNGVRNALSRTLDIPINESTYYFGQAFEHFIIQEFYRLASYRNKDELLFYYQTQGGLEIDLIIEKPGRPLLAIEIKSTNSISKDQLRHLRSFAEIQPKSKRFCISRDPNRKKIDDIDCIFYLDALRMFYDSSIYDL